ncbi:hypothetical protein ACFOOP_00840 [Marinicaulis aureus]|uniref:Uncharacterized protein n=1 Tax=Hyphococcus aureus TaxID=2666033 RepID=A0ABW1KYI2_9PROT
MKRKVAIVIGALMISTSVFASEVMEKCVAVVGPLGSPDPEGQCTCFVDAMTDEQAEEYLAVADWESDASDELKNIGAQCFPEIN